MIRAAAILGRGFVAAVVRREDDIRRAWKSMSRDDYQRAIADGASRKGNVIRFVEVR